jgi:hypothetical protein
MDLELLVLLGGVSACALAGYVWLRSRPPEQAASLSASLSARCPRCSQKVRYPASRAGRASVCPQCRRNWTLPAAAEAPPPSGGTEVYRVRRR